MFNLKSIIEVVAILLSTTAHAQTDTVKTLQKQLKLWQPIEIKESNNVVTVVLDANQVTPEIYGAVISSGICMDVWTKDVPNSYMKTTKELHVLNKHKAFGYVLEQPLATCNEMGKEPDDRAKVVMLSKTHMFGMPKSK
ncbi:hypothetical protein [Rosenbergiella epipactidis]|uniref:hypothetical protein n=1 Tax=Rosenbergiella epipactidis TaxID=1544694 RepID=UPI001F4D3CF0|nr:hypothetical protein [Rosenbergiella epipactidis]